MIIIFVNCSLFPFIDWIIKGLKQYETRNKNTLFRFIGKTVYLAETGRKKPVVRCSCTISNLVIITDKKTYDRYRKQTMIKKGSVFDWTEKTRKKCLYRLENVKELEQPITIPDNAIRHGRIYATVD